MRWLWILVAIAGCATPTRPAPGAGAGQDERPPDLSGLDRALHREANAARQSAGASPLQWSDALADVAAAHSRDMAERGYFDHVSPNGTTPNDRALARGIDCQTPLGGGRTRVGVTENLYQGWRYGRVWTRETPNGVSRTYEWRTRDDLARETVRGWLDSPGHRRNLLDPVPAAHGLGVTTDAEGRVYVTQVLC